MSDERDTNNDNERVMREIDTGLAEYEEEYGGEYHAVNRFRQWYTCVTILLLIVLLIIVVAVVVGGGIH